MRLSPFQKMLVTVSNSLTLSEQSAVLGFSPDDIQRLKDLLRDVAARNQAEALQAREAEQAQRNERPQTANAVKRLRKCPQCNAMVRLDHLDDHRQKVHKPPQGKRLKGKQLRASRLKGAAKLGFNKGSTTRSKSIRAVQGGLCNGR